MEGEEDSSTETGILGQLRDSCPVRKKNMNIFDFSQLEQEYASE